ncbi:ABC transporter permease [Microbacterium sp.]|uniref:ABC transporter permease n=1 Tax=Microbacterium sp. TaxID=51671 RepID=UPI003F709240
MAARTQRAATVLAVMIVALLSVPPLVVLAVQGVHGRDAQTVTPERLLQLLGNTLLLSALVVGFSLVIGTATAVITQRSTLRGRRVWSTLVTVPLVLPAYVIAVALSGMLGGGGTLSQWLAPLGIDRLPPAVGLWAATACLTIVGVPVVHALVSAALARLDPALEETARLLGDPPARAFARVVLPQLRGTLALGACVIALYVVSDFGAVSMLRYDTFTRAVYAQFRGRVDLAPAFALCSILVMVAAVFVIGQVVLRGREHAAAANARPAAPRRWGAPARIAAVVLLCAVVTASSILPIATLATWTLRGLGAGAQPGPVLVEAGNALLYGLLASIVTTVLAVPIALAARRRTRFGRVIEAVPWITHSLPHLAVGLAILVLALRGPPVLYQSTTALVLAYAVLFLPLAVAPLSVALRRIDERLLDASRVLGGSDAATLGRIVLPLALPAALTGAVLVFFAAFHELPATLLLRPTGAETLAVRLWGAMVEGQYTTASIAALLMVAISVPLLGLHARATVREAVAA